MYDLGLLRAVISTLDFSVRLVTAEVYSKRFREFRVYGVGLSSGVQRGAK